MKVNLPALSTNSMENRKTHYWIQLMQIVLSKFPTELAEINFKHYIIIIFISCIIYALYILPLLYYYYLVWNFQRWYFLWSNLTASLASHSTIKVSAIHIHISHTNAGEDNAAKLQNMRNYLSFLMTQVGRLMQNSLEKTPDTNRTQQNSIYREMGPVNSYAWKGYNWACSVQKPNAVPNMVTVWVLLKGH